MSQALISELMSCYDPQTSDLLVNGYSRASIINSNLLGNDIIIFSFLGLSSYEVLAPPRIIKHPEKLFFSQQQLERLVKEVFRCSICLNILLEPVNIKTCLHKFCKKCIEEYHRKIKKECVICRQFIETRRHMRDDETMSIISK